MPGTGANKGERGKKKNEKEKKNAHRNFIHIVLKEHVAFLTKKKKHSSGFVCTAPPAVVSTSTNSYLSKLPFV